jgi:ribosomal-protein-serine acetyltransferase
MKFIQDSIARYERNRSFDAGIWSGDTLIGVVGYHDINWAHKEVEIGYWIDKTHEGRGHTKRAVKLLITYAFLEYRLNRVQIKCSTENMRSRSLAEKIGFIFEGVEREGLCFRGKFFDVACYSLLSKDYQPNFHEDTILQVALPFKMMS